MKIAQKDLKQFAFQCSIR